MPHVVSEPRHKAIYLDWLLLGLSWLQCHNYRISSSSPWNTTLRPRLKGRLDTLRKCCLGLPPDLARLL